MAVSNNDGQSTNHTPRPVKKLYTKPTLSVYGDLRKVTEGGMDMGFDGGNAGNNSSTHV
jgi:hypothetical protein